MRWKYWGSAEARGTGLTIGAEPFKLERRVHAVAFDRVPCGSAVDYEELRLSGRYLQTVTLRLARCESSSP
jgi:hypothetical protein